MDRVASKFGIHPGLELVNHHRILTGRDHVLNFFDEFLNLPENLYGDKNLHNRGRYCLDLTRGKKGLLAANEKFADQVAYPFFFLGLSSADDLALDLDVEGSFFLVPVASLEDGFLLAFSFLDDSSSDDFATFAAVFFTAFLGAASSSLSASSAVLALAGFFVDFGADSIDSSETAAVFLEDFLSLDSAAVETDFA